MYILRYYLRQLFNRVKSNLSFWQNISDLPVTEPSFMCSLKKLELEKQWSPKHQKKLFKRFLIHVKTAKVFLWKGQVAYCFNQGICDKSTITYCIFPHAMLTTAVLLWEIFFPLMCERNLSAAVLWLDESGLVTCSGWGGLRCERRGCVIMRTK